MSESKYKQNIMESSVLIESSIKRSTAITERSHQRQRSGSFLHDSYTSSIDFPAYIPWQTLSSDLSDRLRYFRRFELFYLISTEIKLNMNSVIFGDFF